MSEGSNTGKRGQRGSIEDQSGRRVGKNVREPHKISQCTTPNMKGLQIHQISEIHDPISWELKVQGDKRRLVQQHIERSPEIHVTKDHHTL